MTDEQKLKIAEMRSKGTSYAKIGAALGIQPNTVKTYCNRNKVPIGVMPQDNVKTSITCRACGKYLNHTDGRRKRVFCCKECRERWWHAHPEKINQKAVYKYTCAGCGKAFEVYGNSHRKYCSHVCYINARFKGGGCHE